MVTLIQSRLLQECGSRSVQSMTTAPSYSSMIRNSDQCQMPLQSGQYHKAHVKYNPTSLTQPTSCANPPPHNQQTFEH